MAVWTLMPVNKKSIEEVMYWEKDGKTVFFRQGWRGGSVTVTTADDKAPEIDLDSDELSVYDLYDDHIVDVELDSFWDGCWGEWDWAVSGLTEEEQQEIEEAWDDNGYEGVEDLGWNQTDTEVYFYGELSLERINEN
jgi:hypothetical protein